MRIVLTPALLETSYELLRLTEPFRRWKLPHADEIKFIVSRHHDLYGHCEDGETVTISQHKHAQLGTLLATMSHEMIHVYEFRTGMRGDVCHGATFKKLAALVCSYHGFDPAAF